MSPTGKVIALLAGSWACLLVAWFVIAYMRWRRLQWLNELWRAREDMEAALWAECTADAARNPPALLQMDSESICNKVDSAA